ITANRERARSLVKCVNVASFHVTVDRQYRCTLEISIRPIDRTAKHSKPPQVCCGSSRHSESAAARLECRETAQERLLAMKGSGGVAAGTGLRSLINPLGVGGRPLCCERRTYAGHRTRSEKCH